MLLVSSLYFVLLSFLPQRLNAERYGFLFRLVSRKQKRLRQYLGNYNIKIVLVLFHCVDIL